MKSHEYRLEFAAYMNIFLPEYGKSYFDLRSVISFFSSSI
jgi:hypothetical protein